MSCRRLRFTPLEIPVVATRDRAGHRTQPELFWPLTPLQSPAPHGVQGRAGGIISNGVKIDRL